MAIGITLRLYDGAVAKTSVTGITALWWDQTVVYDFGSPIGRTDVAATDGDGDLELDLSDVSGLTTGQDGFLLLYKLDGGDHKDSPIFAGKITTSDVTGATKLTYDSGWVRPATWPDLSSVASGQKFSGLYAVFPRGPNWCAFTFTCSDTSQYTVDWGDSTADDNVATGVAAQHSYAYTNCSDNDIGKADAIACTFTDTNDRVYIANHSFRNGDMIEFSAITTTTGITVGTIYYVVNPTKAVTFTVATNKVNLTAHGYLDGETVRFTKVTTTTGISPHTSYYIVNKAADTFELSLTLGGATIDLTGADGTGTLFKNDYFIVADTVDGAAKTLTNDGSGSIYRPIYRMAVVDVIPTTGGKHLVTANFNVRHSGASSAAAVDYTTGWLDIAIHAANMTSCIFSSATLNCVNGLLERFVAHSLGTVASYSYMFGTCKKLKEISLPSTASGTNFSSMFYNCYSLQSIPLLNTAIGTNFSSMFYNCYSLQSIPLLSTSAGTDFSYMFYNCLPLQLIPLLNTAVGTNFSYMFYNCYSLQSIPLLNTAAGTNFSHMFDTCSSLQSIPLLNTAIGTNFSYMFYNCYSLQSIPLLNTAAGTNFSHMFDTCSSLQSIPLLNTAIGTNFSYMFNNCYSLQLIPLLSTSAGTDFSSIFSNCYSLQVGALAGTAQSITYPAGQLSGAELDAIYTGLATAVSKTITVTGNYGTAADTPSIATDKGWTVTA